MKSDEESIRNLVATWTRASASGDLAKISALMADDVVFLTPGREPFGRKEFEASFRSLQGQVRMEPVSDIQEVVVSGTLAYCRSKLKVAITSLSTGERRERSGYTLTVLRKNDDGNWVIARDANLMA